MVRVRGRLSTPSEGGIAFVTDHSGTLEVRGLAENVAPGTWLEAQGLWDGEALTVDPTTVRLGRSPVRPFPEPDGEWARLHRDDRRRLRMLRARGVALRRLREALWGDGFLEVDTPALTHAPATEVYVEPIGVDLERRAWLVPSPELAMKRLLAAGLPQIFQLSHVFRRDELGELHEPEFTLLEWYRAFAEAEDVMTDTEAVVLAVARALSAEGHSLSSDADLRPPWPRLTVEDAFLRHAGRSAAEILGESEDAFHETLAVEVQPHLGLEKPTFLTEWPRELASLAQLKPGDPHVAERFELYLEGLELCNGFGELTDPVEQRARIGRELATRDRLGKPALPVPERFLAALDEGLPPCAGNALGVDRLLMALLGAPQITDIVPFGIDRS